MASATYLQQAYLAYFGRPADVSGLSFYADKTEAQVVAAFSASAESQAFFGSMNTLAQINTIYQNLFNRAAEPAGLTYWANEINSGRLSLAQASMGILAGAQNADKTAVTNKLAAAAAFTAALDTTDEMIGYQGTAVITSARAFLAGVSTEATLAAATTAAALSASVAAVVAAGTASTSAGQTFTLTTGVDSFTGGAGDDLITGFIGTGATLGLADTVNGGGGNNTLRVYTDAATTTIPSAVTNIQNLLINDTAHESRNIATGDLSGVSSLTLQGGVTVDGATVTVTLGSGDSVTFDGVLDADAGAATVADGGISIAQAATLTSVALTVKDSGAATANTATTIGLAGTGVTTANLTVTGTNHVNLLNAGGAQTTLNISGAGTLTTYTDLATTVTTVNGAAATGVLSLDLGGTSVRNVTGGTAADIFRLGADYVGGATGATRDIINGGEGRDTLSITVARAADTVATTAQSNLTSIEILTISDAWTTGVGIDLTKFTGVDTVTFPAAIAGTSSMTLNSGTAVTLGINTGTDAVTTFVVGGVGVADTMTLNMAGFDWTTGGTSAFATTGIETLNITTGTTVTDAATMSGTTNMTVSAGSTGGVINVSGANAMTFTGVVTAAAINASALTGILTVTATAANAISITGGTGADVIGGSASADLITGGNGADTITGRAGNDSIVLTETTAAVDKVVFTGGATAAAALTANGMDTITGFGTTDTLNIAALGDGTTSATGLTTVNAAAAQAALVDDTVVILNVAATAGALATGGTATVTDFTNMTQVAAFLSERYTTTNDADQENVVVWNVGTTTYVYHVDTVAGGSTAIAAAEIVLLGTITQGAALVAANLVYA